MPGLLGARIPLVKSTFRCAQIPSFVYKESVRRDVHILLMQTGKTVQLYKGHSGPVTSLVFYDTVSGSGDENLLITGSWDKVGSPSIPLSVMKGTSLIHQQKDHQDLGYGCEYLPFILRAGSCISLI